MDPVLCLLDEKITRILRIFAKNKNKTFYLREISQMSKVPVASAHRLMKKIVRTGIIEEVKVSKFTFYRLSRKKSRGLMNKWKE